MIPVRQSKDYDRDISNVLWVCGERGDEFFEGKWVQASQEPKRIMSKEERTGQAKELNEQKLSTRNPYFPLLCLPILMMRTIYQNTKL